MSSSSNLIKDMIQSAQDYEGLKLQAIEGAASSVIHGVPLNRRTGTFFPFMLCLCVQDAPDNPCHCVGPILWIDEKDIFGFAKAGRKCLDGREVFSLRVKMGSRLVEERHVSVSLEELQSSAGVNLGSRFAGPSWPSSGLAFAARTHERATLDLLRRPVVETIRNAAKEIGAAIDTEALALALQPGLLFANAPIAGLDKLDFRALLDGRPVLEETPVMFWHVSGERLTDENSPIPAGFYTVVATERRGRVNLRDAAGNMVAEGNLDIGVGSTTGVAKISVSGGIDTLKFGKHSFKLCGHVEIDVGIATVSINGCIEVSG
jgi:hypothetical protein